MINHTPGPWKYEWSNDVGPDDDYYVEFFEILTEKNDVIGQADKEEDARLMAAAPELLKTACLVMDWWSVHQYDTTGEYGEYNLFDIDPPFVTEARAALAKVLGEQQ